jgi:hypothetical protein
MIRLSIVMPTNRDNLAAISRITQACSLAGPSTEVIIRDNSGSASKRRLLAQIEKENCHIIISDPCGVHENWWEAFEKAKGDFVMFICDDDICFDRGIAVLPQMIEGVIDDASVAGIVGATIVYGARGISTTLCDAFDADNAPARLSLVLSSGNTSSILYSPVRRKVLKWTIETIRQKPFRFSFDDQLSVLLYILQGRFVPLDRLLYCYDPGNWEFLATAQQEHLKYYIGTSLDPALNKLHWLLCAFEGAALIRNLPPLSAYSLSQRQQMADCWFSYMFTKFQQSKQEDLGSAFAADAEKLCVKWKAAAGQLSFEALLADICQFLMLFSVQDAMRYFAYWGNILGLRQAPAA